MQLSKYLNHFLFNCFNKNVTPSGPGGRTERFLGRESEDFAAVPLPLLTRQTLPAAASWALTLAAYRAPPPRMVPESKQITEEKALGKPGSVPQMKGSAII